MIQIHNFNFAFEATANTNTTPIISNFNLAILPGQVVAILGPNGVGKTTILQNIWLHSFLPQHVSHAKLPIKKAFITQHIPELLDINIMDKQLDFYSVAYQIFEQELAQNTSHITRQSLFLPSFDAFFEWYCTVVCDTLPNFFNDFHTYLFDFNISPGSLATEYQFWSPGTKKKVLLSLLFASKPDAILADELTNHLDAAAVEVVSRILSTLRSAVLLIDHSPRFLSKNVRHWVYLPLNTQRIPTIFHNMNYDEVMQAINDRQAHQITVAKNLQNKQKKLENSLEMQQKRVEVYGVGIGSVASSLQKRLQREVENNPIHDVLDRRQEFQFRAQKNQGKTKKDNQIVVKNLCFAIGKTTQQNIASFMVYRGDRIRITGQNGRGKSTLLSLISTTLSGLQLSTHAQYISGSISVSTALTPSLVFIFQQVSTYPSAVTIQWYIHQHVRWQDYQIMPFLKKVRLDRFFASTPLSHLSLGEFVRLQFGLLAERLSSLEMVILDEPGNFLDVFTQQALVQLLSGYTGTLIFVTHAQDFADKIGEYDEFTVY